MQQLQQRDQHDEQTLEEWRQLEREFQRQQMKLQSLQQRQRRSIKQPDSPMGAAVPAKRQRIQRESQTQQLDFKIQQQFKD